MKLGVLIDVRFQKVFEKLSQASLPLKTAFKLKGIAKVVREQAATYEEVRQAALQKYGLKNEDGSLKVDDGGNVQFGEEGMNGFAKELQDLIDVEVEVASIKLSELDNSVSLTLAEAELLDGVVVSD